MAEIGDQYNTIPLFATPVVRYKIEFNEKEKSLLDTYTDQNFVQENSIIDSIKYDPETDENFKINFLTENLLQLNSKFHSIRDAVLECANHYLTQVWGFEIGGTQLVISDSWFIHSRGENEMRVFKKHNHSWSLLTAVLYLDDTDNGLMLTPIGGGAPKMWYPFLYQPREDNEFNSDEFFFRPEAGDLLIMPAKMEHAIVKSDNPNDVRNSIAINIWPHGEPSIAHSARLNTNDFKEYDNGR